MYNRENYRAVLYFFQDIYMNIYMIGSYNKKLQKCSSAALVDPLSCLGITTENNT